MGSLLARNKVLLNRKLTRGQGAKSETLGDDMQSVDGPSGSLLPVCFSRSSPGRMCDGPRIAML